MITMELPPNLLIPLQHDILQNPYATFENGQTDEHI